MRPKATISTLLLILALATSSRAQSPDSLCGMVGLSTLASCPTSTETLDGSITIPVVVHVIADDNGTGDVALSVIEDQIDVMNESFVETGSTTRFQFSLAGVGRVRNTDWHEMLMNHAVLTAPEGQAKYALNVDPLHVLNLYVANPNHDGNEEEYGWATFPFEYQAQGATVYFPEDHFMHGVVVDYNTLPGGSEPTYGYDEGDTAAHETGHYLGLFHTWGVEDAQATATASPIPQCMTTRTPAARSAAISAKLNSSWTRSRTS